MKKLESTWYNMAIVLTAITVIAGAALGYVNDITKGPIAAIKEKTEQTAIAQVLPNVILHLFCNLIQLPEDIQAPVEALLLQVPFLYRGGSLLHLQGHCIVPGSILGQGIVYGTVQFLHAPA